MWPLWALSWVAAAIAAEQRGTEVGCFAFSPDSALDTHAGRSLDECLAECERLYYGYSLVVLASCYCSESTGVLPAPPSLCAAPCPADTDSTCVGARVASVYSTGVVTPGPPQNLTAQAVGDVAARVFWAPPAARRALAGYNVRATPQHALTTTSGLVLTVSNNTLRADLLGLHPGTLYNVTVAAVGLEEEGPSAAVLVETEIGTPDPSPLDAEMKERHGDRMVIRIPAATNENGPITFYRVVVSIEVHQQGFIPENLKDYYVATQEGLPYYITAEIDPESIKDDFIVGDKHTYNGYYNAPLPLTNDIDISIGVVSEKNNVRKVRYADASKKVILNINEPEEVSGLVVALGAAIAICVVLLLIGIGLVIILRKKIQLAHAQRCSQSMPLSMSEPCIEIENCGFLPEEDERVDHYGNLKRKLWNIPRNLIEFDISCVAGMGSYGKFTRGKVQQHGAQTPSLIQIIGDRELERGSRRVMLQELDLLIKSSDHENLISLIGICETSTALFVVLQDARETVKELLISCRHRDLQNNKFSLITEARVIQICIDVARGMEYLHSKKILHKRLCCRNVVLADGGVTKVTGFGLSHIHPLNESPDYMRWTAQEMLQQTRYNPKADVWSYGCLLWEMFTLGATPYPQTPNKEVVMRVLRGMRPPQPSYVGDELFQVSLQCWQVDPDERPTFASLLTELAPFATNSITRYLSFTHYSDFSYEPFMPGLETAT